MVLELVKRLLDAVDICYDEEITSVDDDLNKLSNKQLIKNFMMMQLRRSSSECDEDGSLILKLIPENIDKPFVCIFKTGEPVYLRTAEDKFIPGIVMSVHRRGIEVGTDPKFSNLLNRPTLKVTVRPDPGPLNTLKSTLLSVEKYLRNENFLEDLMENLTLSNSDPQPEKNKAILDLMLGNSEVKEINTLYEIGGSYFEKLNEKQRESVEHGIRYNLTVIHGPPGTGKSTSIVALLEQLIKNQECVVICGPSNVSVDSVLEKIEKEHIYQSKLDILRLGHRYRMNDKVHKKFSLDARIESEPETQKLKRKIKELSDDANESPGLMLENSQKMEKLKSRLLELRDEHTKKYIGLCKVLAGTLQGLSKHNLSKFTTVIIDEASQCNIPLCCIPAISMTKGKRLVLSGDNLQLPPTVRSNVTKVKKVLGLSIFDFLLEKYGNEHRKMLTVQHRMNKEIMEFPSVNVYDDKLIAAASVENIRHADNNWVLVNELTKLPLLWIDTSNILTNSVFMGSSSANNEEALLVRQTVERLNNLDVRNEDIGVISPYNYQKAVICLTLGEKFKHVEVSSIDGFQGREKDVIIISLVKTQVRGSNNFLSNKNRLNVALTRSKMMLCVIGNIQGLRLSYDIFLRSLIDHFAIKGKIERASLSPKKKIKVTQRM